MRKEEEKLIAFELLLATVMLVLIVWGVLEIIHGSMWAVLLSMVPAVCMSLLLEDVDRIREQAKKREEDGREPEN